MEKNRSLIFVCSPYRGDVEANVKNARAYCRFVFEQGGIPFAPHLLFTQFLNDSEPLERDAGLCMGLEMLMLCDELWAFGDPTLGMSYEIAAAVKGKKSIVYFDGDCREVARHE